MRMCRPSGLHSADSIGAWSSTMAPAALVPDQVKSGVARSCWYDPKIQRTYEAMAEHYGTTVMPARPGKPRDKAKVENGVLIVQRWILARVRNETFYSLDELNCRVDVLQENLPTERFEFCEWKQPRVNIDYHVEVDRHYYSVPSTLVGEIVDARFTASTVELLHRGKRVASHIRSYVAGKHTTKTEHMPKSHQKHAEWTPSRIITWATETGPRTAELAAVIMKERRHPEQYRSCLGILRLGKTYGTDRLEAACARAIVARARSYGHVESILKAGLDRVPLPELSETPPTHPDRPRSERHARVAPLRPSGGVHDGRSWCSR